MAVRHKWILTSIAKTAQVCERSGMFRRILLLCLALMLVGGGSVYGQTQTSKTIKLKPPKKAKAPKVKKPPKPPAPKLTAGEKAAQKANQKQIHTQQKAFKKQNEQTEKQLKSQQKAYTKQLRTAEKQARKTK